MRTRGRRGSQRGRGRYSAGPSRNSAIVTSAIRTPVRRGQPKRGRGRTPTRGGPIKTRVIAKQRTPTRGRGRGRGRRGEARERGRSTRGRGRSTPVSSNFGLSGDKLDKDLEDYFKQDPQFSAKKLDTEMEEYWAQKPEEDGDASGVPDA